MKNFNKLLLAFIMTVMAFGVDALTFTSGYLKYETNSANDAVYVKGLTTSGENVSSLSLTIPATVTYNGTTYRVWGISSTAFQNKTNIDNVTIQWSMRIIDTDAFRGCTGLRWLRLPSSIYRLGADAFNGCTALKWVYYPGFNFPEGGVSSTTFPNNSGMTLYISHDSQPTPSDYKASSGWSRFATVTNSIEAYDWYMADGGYYTVGSSDSNPYSTTRTITLTGFNKNGSNTSSGTVYTAMDGGTFKPSGQSITFKVTSLGHNAFSDQTTLKTVNLPGTITSYRVGAQYAAFFGATSLTAINVASGCVVFSSYDGCLYTKDGTNLLRVPEGKTSISYKSTITGIGYYAFRNCAMSTVRIPYGVKTIYSCAFAYTPNMDWLYIPSSVTSFAEDALWHTKNNIYLYMNMPTPPTCYPDAMFGITLSNANLYVPYGKIDAYKSAGWTGFTNYNNNSKQACDAVVSNMPYTVTSTARTNVNGTYYDGRVKLVCGEGTGENNSTTFDIPASISINGKSYAVTMIGEDAFNNHTSSFTVTGCVNVDTIGAYAFQSQPITSYPFTHKSSRYIMAYAFDGAGLTGTVALPYGVQMLGTYSFGHGKYSRLVVPGSISNFYGSFCTNTSTLTELVINLPYSWSYTFTGWDLTGLPSNCYIRVPVGVVNHYKQNSKFSSRASYITAGAYDFAYANDYSGRYFMTILSTASTTFDGTTYDGKAKYVYHPNIAASTLDSYGFCTYYEQDQTVSSDKRKYLITEIGDSCFYGAKFATGTLPKALTRIGYEAFRGSSYAENNLVLPSGLTSIGHDAFYDSKIKGELKVPTSVTSLEGWALCASTLSSIYFPADMNMPTMGSTVWSSSIGTVWVPNSRANSYLTEAKKWGTSYANKLAVFIKPSRSTVTFGSVVPVDMQAIGINAYIASAYDKTDPTKQVTLTRVNKAPENTGLLLTDLTDKEYRIPRPSGSVSAPSSNYLVAVSAQTNVYTVSGGVGYYWDGIASPVHFKKPTSDWYVGGPSYERTYGSAYLKLSSAEAGSLTDVYTNMWPYTPPVGLPGDYNGDNKVDINDVNMTINMMLGKLPYKAICDMNNDNKIDITDVNLVIQKMLGK